MYKAKESCALTPSNYNNKTANEKLQDYMKIWFTGSKEATTTYFCMYPQKQKEQSNGHNGVFPASDLLIPNSSSV